jgi:protoporphyrinogen oxidase
MLRRHTERLKISLRGGPKSPNVRNSEILQTLESLREAVSNIVDKVEDRFEEDAVTYTKAVETFVKKTTKLVSSNDATFQKALFTFAEEFVTSARKGKRKKSLKIPVQSTSRSRSIVVPYQVFWGDQPTPKVLKFNSK